MAQELMEPSKTGEIALPVILDQPRQQGLGRLPVQRSQSLTCLEPTSENDYQQLRISCEKMVIGLNLTILHPVLHVPRHGSPSYDRTDDLRSLLAV